MKPPPSTRTSPSRAIAILIAATLALAVWLVFRGALAMFFAQEDFRGLAVAKGLLPRHDTLWRYVSVQTFMDVFHPWFGDQPRPYHAVTLASHAINAIMLFGLLSRRTATAPATIAAFFFATHPAFFTALYWQSARADVLATTFALGTVSLALLRGRVRWLALPVFALALLSKESVILLPFVVWLVRRWAGASKTGPSLDRLSLALGIVSLGFGIYLLGGRAGIGVGTGPAEAYALSFGESMYHNLLTYAGWTADVAMRPSPLRFLDIRNPDLYGFGFASLGAWALGGLVPGLRGRGWWTAGATFLLLLAPVLPLRNHTYHYFLAAPLAAAAWCVAAVFDFVLERPAPGRTATVGAWIVAAACAAALTWNGARLTHKMETRPMEVYPALRGDPIVCRAQVAETVIAGLKRAGLPPGVGLTFVMRERLALMGRVARGSGEAPPPAGDTYPEVNLRNAVHDGYGVRALVPHVATVAFTRGPVADGPRTLYVVYAPTGEVELYSRSQLDSLLNSPWVDRWR